ncbi:MAG: hypothetical protein JXA42_18310 [Anaerolineales bacterium]|nr:hypothetical protein [Anaerolineales bacterium]
MNEKNFQELLSSLREGAAILRGEKQPSRRFKIEKRISKKQKPSNESPSIIIECQSNEN